MKKILIPVVLFVISLLFLAGCGTSSSVVKLGEAPAGYTTLTHEGITLKLSYLDQRDLYKLYGQNNNPFMNYKTGRLIVVEISILSDAPLQVNLNEAVLSTPGGERGLTSREEVYEYWYSRLINNYGTKSRFSTPHKSSTMYQESGGSNTNVTSYSYMGTRKNDYHDWSLKVTTQIIDETILPSDFEVQTGLQTAGYILFEQVRGEKKVNAELTLPVYDNQGELLHNFTYTFPI